MKKIPLTQGYFALVDDDFIVDRKWRISKTGNKIYAFANAKKEEGGCNVSMHRLIMRPKKNMEVDHIDGNGLNNQRSNLRICTRAENALNRRINNNNTSGFKGVTFVKEDGKWQVQIAAKRRFYYLGRYDSKVEAAMVYNVKARELFGKYAVLNVIPNA